MKQPTLTKNKTVIVGCGRLGASIANKCIEERKNIVVVDKDRDSLDLLSDRFSGYTTIGDVTDLAVLESAYIKSANEVIVVTGDDNVNIFIAHVAKKIYNVPNIYVRLADPDDEILLRGMSIHAIYPFELSYDKLNMMRGGRKRWKL